MGSYEGAECATDINECVRATDDCSGNATCINTDGGFTCSCWWGFEGAALTSDTSYRAACTSHKEA